MGDCKDGKEAEAKDVIETLDMTALAKAERQPQVEEHEKVERALDEEVLIIFELPDGSEGERFFKMGHTVEVLKSFVAEEFEIPMNVQRLFLDGSLMLDPLTLSDYPAITPSKTVFIRVEGTIPESAAKK